MEEQNQTRKFKTWGEEYNDVYLEIELGPDYDLPVLSFCDI
jgi:hypothetical protein